MICPKCKKNELKEVLFHKVKVDKCKKCSGIWFEADELRKAKDQEDKYLKWLDIDLWKDKEKFKASPSQKGCPKCNLPLYEIEYGKSDIKIDVCKKCNGIWLDKGEFEKIVTYLRHQADSATLSQYLKYTLGEANEILVGPEKTSSEIEDFLIVSKLLQYKLLIQCPIINDAVVNFPG